MSVTRRRRDSRYGVAVEYAWSILHTDYGVADDFIVHRENAVYVLEPDLWTADKRLCVAIGVLREDTLLEYLKHFPEVIHLPLPKTVEYGPTHYRVFKRSKASEVKGLHIWGDSLIHGRSLRQ